jgi:PHD/YefM family antitoxin component YafN of YafNO toxin-antitoxin module
MEFVPIRDLCASPGKVTARLRREGRIVITSNGRPSAIMLDVDGSSLEETLLDLRRLAAKRALRELQTASVTNGNSKMNMEEIDAEIAASRRERAGRESA